MKTLELTRGILSKEIILERSVSRAIGVSCFAILTALGAYVRIPLLFTPVPITLQTFFVLLSGAVLGRKWGSASQIGYLLLGIVGLPVFAGAGAGFAYLLGPSGGYIIGFIVASWLVGRIIHQKAQGNSSRIVLAMIIGSFAVYFFGLLGLILFLKCNLSQALSLGFLPFIPGDVIKVIGATFLYGKIEKRCRKIFHKTKE